MKIDLNDPRVNEAISVVKKTHNTSSYKELEHVMEAQYHCKVVYEDIYGLSGHLDITEEKYQTWFVLQFGVGE